MDVTKAITMKVAVIVVKITLIMNLPAIGEINRIEAVSFR